MNNKPHHPINLDAATHRTLVRIRRTATDPRNKLAAAMLLARKHRLAGDIRTALRYERSAELHYQNIPTELRW